MPTRPRRIEGRPVAAVDIRSAFDIRSAAEALRDAVGPVGDFRIIVSDNIASRQPMLDAEQAILGAAVFGFEAPHEHWWTNGQLALQSPLARACRYESEPFWANADGIRTRHPNRSLDAIDLTNFEARSLFCAAIVVPVHLPFGQVGMAAFGTTEPGRADLAVPFERHADMLMVLTRRFVASYANVTRRRQWLPTDCRITKREIECLRWAAMGKTDHEIADIIERSHSTIRFHINNAGEKLDAVNRAQAIFKAGQLGYLGQLN